MLPRLLFVFGSYCKHPQVVIGTIINIKVYIAFYSWQFACIGMLPKLPFSFVFHLVNIIVGYPIRIIIKDWRTKILLLKFIIGVNDWLYMIFVFHYMKPCQYITLKIFYWRIFRHVLDVEYWWQVAIFKMHII